MRINKKWKIVNEVRGEKLEVRSDDIIKILLENREIKNKKERDDFLHPKLEDVTTKSVGIDQKQLKKSLERIQKAIEEQEQIIVFGDYDVDGITGSAILWETLYALGAKALPYIPNRIDEGYGLSTKALKNQELRTKNPTLIITVDNGIVANEAVNFANEQSIDVIITDHHTIGEKLPDAHSIVHTTKLCGAGVAYLLSKELRKNYSSSGASAESRSKSSRLPSVARTIDNHLELAALGTVADLVPLTGANRTIVREGLKKLQTSDRPGLLAIYQQAGIKQDEIGVYDIGYKIGPRLNASGRLESAMDSLRLLCTQSSRRAAELAAKLELTNRERQQLLKEAAEDAIAKVRGRPFDSAQGKKILIVGHESYAEGIIGLVAGKLVEEFYRPAIVLSLGETHSKASVRSISGFNIIEFLRLHTDHFINVGGHPMAAGFTVETAKIKSLQEALEKSVEGLLEDELLTRVLKIDCELPFSVLSKELYDQIQQLAPFGMGNPEPVFATKGVTVENIRVLGKEANHLKLVLSQEPKKDVIPAKAGISTSRSRIKSGMTIEKSEVTKKSFEAIAFGMGELAAELKVGDKIEIAYVLDENTWNGETKLQLKVRDINV